MYKNTFLPVYATNQLIISIQMLSTCRTFIIFSNLIKYSYTLECDSGFELVNGICCEFHDFQRCGKENRQAQKIKNFEEKLKAIETKDGLRLARLNRRDPCPKFQFRDPVSKLCVPNQCNCINGIGTYGTKRSENGKNECESCDTGYYQTLEDENSKTTCTNAQGSR